MDAERWERIQRIFHEALEVKAEGRADFVERACADCPEITAEVLALLAEDGSSASPIDRGVAPMANAVLEPHAPLPAEIGPYRIQRVLGEGGMGVVYLAEREDLDSVVAIKFLRDARLSPQRRDRFLREQRILARLSHPSICRLFDAGLLDDGSPYFVMEYVDGLPLTTFCERYGLSLADRLRLFRRVCDAVQHAHSQALIHRDIKPSNILARRTDQEAEPEIKLLDFGIAKQTDPDEQAEPTRTAFGMMTPAYASPEQLRQQPVGVSTDVYSLGVVLYELLTGDLPFDLDGLAPFDAAGTVISTDPERPSVRARGSHRSPAFVSSVGGRAWADLDVMCLTAMHKDPERRYATVEALRRDIDHYLDGEPLDARPDSVRYRFGKFIRRNRRAVAATAAALAVVVVLVAFYTIRLSAARDAAVDQAARTQRVQRFMLDLFEGGDVIAGPEEGLLVSELIERGVRAANVLEEDPEIQAELFHTLGGVYRRAATLDRAEELLRQAIASRRERLGERHPDVAESLTALGLVLSDRGELDEAEDCVREGQAIIEERLPEDHPLVAGSVYALGEVLVSRGDYEGAIRELEEAVHLQERSGDASGLRASLATLADAHAYAGDYETSDSINRRLLSLIEEQLGANHPAYAARLISLGASRRWLGYPGEAEQLYREALAINERYHGREHPTVASNLTLIGAVLTDQERFDEARELLAEALAVNEAVFGPRHYNVGLTRNQLARIELSRGDLDAAEEHFAAELEIYRATRGDDHPSTATGLSNLATIHFRREDYDSAYEMMREAQTIYEAALKPDHMDVGIAHIKVGRSLAGMERYDEALEELTRGYEIVSSQANPAMVWVQLARKQLAAVYEGLGDTERAAEFRDADTGGAE